MGVKVAGQKWREKSSGGKGAGGNVAGVKVARVKVTGEK